MYFIKCTSWYNQGHAPLVGYYYNLQLKLKRKIVDDAVEKPMYTMQ